MPGRTGIRLAGAGTTAWLRGYMAALSGRDDALPYGEPGLPAGASDHRLIVAWMVSRRAGWMFSQLVCCAGVPRIRTVPAQ
jgi:hypothetical protein